MKKSTEELKNINPVIEEPKSDFITKKIHFKKETLRNLVTIASREYFDSKLKQDEMLGLMLDKIINTYYSEQFIKELR